MTELAPIGRGAELAVAMSSLEQWAEQAKAAAYIARSLASTPFVPVVTAGPVTSTAQRPTSPRRC